MAKPAAVSTDIVTSSNPTVIVGKQVKQFLERGTLVLPGDYSPDNALKSAWLILQEVQDKDKNPALKVCSQESIANAILSMVIQGLNPDKKQCYFIVYGKQLLCQRSYFGDEALAKRVMPGISLYYDVIYEGDTFSTEKMMASIGLVTQVKTHIQPFPRKSSNIIGAYCGVVTADGENLGIVLMDWTQIEKSWGKSKTAHFDKSTHKEFPEQMALRTVIRRRCKPIINSSSDVLLLNAVKESELDHTDAELADEVEAQSNGQVIQLPARAEAVEEARPEPVVEDPNDKGQRPRDDDAQKGLGEDEDF